MPKDVSELEEATSVVVVLTLANHSSEGVPFICELIYHALEWVILTHRKMTLCVFGMVDLFLKHADQLLF